MKNEFAFGLARARGRLYRFLGGLYIMEVDAKQLKNLKQMVFPIPSSENGNESDDLTEGYRLLGGYIATASEEKLEDLAADYAKVFLAAGDASGRAAFPYESVYVNRDAQVCGGTQMQMRALYLARGWQPDPNVYRTMEDNIGLMLEYMGILCDELAEAFEADDEEKTACLLEEQRAFVEQHLIRWVPAFTSDVIKYAEYDFYKGVAKITFGFIKNEHSLLGMGGDVWEIA
jgi:anaerobic sulfite reductase subunit A